MYWPLIVLLLDDTSSGGHVRQPISGLGCGRGYLAAIGLDRAV